MTTTASLVEQFAEYLGDLDASLITARQVGEPIPDHEHSELLTGGYLYDVYMFSDSVMRRGQAVAQNAAFVIVVEDVAPKWNPSNVTRTLVQLYVTPAAKLEDVRNAYWVLLGHV